MENNLGIYMKNVIPTLAAQSAESVVLHSVYRTVNVKKIQEN